MRAQTSLWCGTWTKAARSLETLFLETGAFPEPLGQAGTGGSWQRAKLQFHLPWDLGGPRALHVAPGPPPAPVRPKRGDAYPGPAQLTLPLSQLLPNSWSCLSRCAGCSGSLLQGPSSQTGPREPLRVIVPGWVPSGGPSRSQFTERLSTISPHLAAARKEMGQALWFPSASKSSPQRKCLGHHARAPPAPHGP